MNRSLAFAAMFACLSALPVLAQEYPTRPVRVIVGFPAGGGSDLIARVFAQKLTGALDLFLRSARISNERFAFLGENRLRFDGLDHPGVGRLAGGFRQRSDALLQVVGQLQRRRRRHGHSPRGATKVTPQFLRVKKRLPPPS